MTGPYWTDGRVELWHGDSLNVLATMDAGSVDAVVCDPPYNLTAGKKGGTGAASVNLDSPAGRARITADQGGFMGKSWDDYDHYQGGFQGWCTAWAAECYRLLKPGGHLLAFGGTRTWHRLAAGIEDAGFEVRDSLMWVHGQGFPKSTDPGCRCPRRVESSDGSTKGFDTVEQIGTVDLSSVRNPVSSFTYETSVAMGSDLLTSVPRKAGCGEVADGSTSRAGSLDRREQGVLPAEDVGRGEPGMERWRDGAAPEGQLRSVPDGPVPGGFVVDAARERSYTSAPARHGTPDRSTIDAVGMRESHRPQPAEQRAGEPGVVPVEPRPQTWGGRQACARCGKPIVKGLGTALKPAFEPIVVARKPLAGTVAANVLTHGTGALNIDGCRIKASGRPHIEKTGERWAGSSMDAAGSRSIGVTNLGRWPANVVLDEFQAAALDEQSGTLISGKMRAGIRRQVRDGAVYGRLDEDATLVDTFGDSGGASRFFYTAKASRSERPAVDGLAHPTVKPLSLMRWLVRLVTPPGGVVLDPFAGSGTTVEAAMLEGFRCVAVEREVEYLPLIRARIDRAAARLVAERDASAVRPMLWEDDA